MGYLTDKPRLFLPRIREIKLKAYQYKHKNGLFIFYNRSYR